MSSVTNESVDDGDQMILACNNNNNGGLVDQNQVKSNYILTKKILKKID